MRLSRPGFSGWLLRFFLPLLVLVVVFLLVLVLVLLLVLVLEGERSVQRASVNAAAEYDGSVWRRSQSDRGTAGNVPDGVCPVAAGGPLRSLGFPARVRCCVLLTVRVAGRCIPCGPLTPDPSPPFHGGEGRTLLSVASLGRSTSRLRVGQAAAER